MYYHTIIIIPAGGSSSRFGSRNKLLCDLHGIPVFCHSIRMFRTLVPDSNIVLSVNPEFRSDFETSLARCFPGNEIRMVNGGSSRTGSVCNALNLFAEKSGIEYVAVHDAARPLTSQELTEKILQACIQYGAALAAHRVTDTIKKIESDGFLSSGGVDREQLWAVETPQIFRFNDLLEATRLAVKQKRSFTDDAAAVEFFKGQRVFPVENQSCNLKITHAEDLALAESLFNEDE